VQPQTPAVQPVGVETFSCRERICRQPRRVECRQSRDRLAKRPESAGEGRDELPVEAAESGPCDATSKDDELMAEHEVLGQKSRARLEECQDDGSQALEDRGHGPVVPR
jgi:hypothetical protein